MRDEGSDGPAALAFARFTRAVHLGLPSFLQRVVPQTFIGYALINGSAFLLDLGIASLINQIWQLSYPVSFSIGYGIASVYAFFLNRTLNFREHGDLGRQTGKYVAVIVSNYLIWIVGFSALLDSLNVQFQVARVVTACFEGVYIYVMLRLWVFPRHRADRSRAQVAESGSSEATPG
ncbi:MAG: GtrA family protein [Propioniciclava sp.]